jgi:hypothetical protein
LSFSDDIVAQVSPVQRQGDLTIRFQQDRGSVKQWSWPSYGISNRSFLPVDFTVDETLGVPFQASNLLSQEMLDRLCSIANHVHHHAAISRVELDSEQIRCIR